MRLGEMELEAAAQAAERERQTVTTRPVQLRQPMALVVSGNHEQRKQRLVAARDCLVDATRQGFGRGRLDFEKKQLIGDNRYVLEWRVRTHPELSPSYVPV
jgi:hypothetical protein